jgi:inner membrane protein
MPTVMTHALVGAAMGKLFTSRKMPACFWVTTAALTTLPDLDVIAFGLGIPYEAPLGHRGLSHSLAFALVAAAIATLLTGPVLGGRWTDLWGFYFAAAASHGLLDACTDGGLGVAFFAPFDSTRYFFPWRPIRVSPIGAGFFSRAGLETMTSEIIWIWLPAGAALGSVLLLRRLMPARRTEKKSDPSQED